MASQERLLFPLFIPNTKGECLSYFRKQLSLTQDDVSKDVGLTRSMISKMESGAVMVSERVWDYIIQKIYESYHLEDKISYEDFLWELEQVYEKQLKHKRMGLLW